LVADVALNRDRLTTSFYNIFDDCRGPAGAALVIHANLVSVPAAGARARCANSAPCSGNNENPRHCLLRFFALDDIRLRRRGDVADQCEFARIDTITFAGPLRSGPPVLLSGSRAGDGYRETDQLNSGGSNDP